MRMPARRLGALLGGGLAALVVLTGVGGQSPARADDPPPTTDTTLAPTTLPPTTSPPSTTAPTTSTTRRIGSDTTVGTAPPDTQPGISVDQPTDPSQHTTTTRRGTHSTTTADATDTTTLVAGVTETTDTLPDDTAVTDPPSTEPDVTHAALPVSHHGGSSTGKLLLLVLGALGLGGVALVGFGSTRRRRIAYDGPFPTMVLPPVLPDLDDEPEPEPAPVTDWAPLWDADVAAPVASTAATEAATAATESARARRKRERHERFVSEHGFEAAVDPEPQRVADPEPESVAEAPRPFAADPYEVVDLASSTPLDPGLPEMDIDLSGPDL
ncbi:MAG TPA: hypothetical protein VHD87_01945 [Acidimicrobiales bacterium]|nr:hypothetical protein [Acidimicrobiales bacterium]